MVSKAGDFFPQCVSWSLLPSKSYRFVESGEEISCCHTPFLSNK